jgi:hypothetical protein
VDLGCLFGLSSVACKKLLWLGDGDRGGCKPMAKFNAHSGLEERIGAVPQGCDSARTWVWMSTTSVYTGPISIGAGVVLASRCFDFAISDRKRANLIRI